MSVDEKRIAAGLKKALDKAGVAQQAGVMKRAHGLSVQGVRIGAMDEQQIENAKARLDLNGAQIDEIAGEHQRGLIVGRSMQRAGAGAQKKFDAASRAAGGGRQKRGQLIESALVSVDRGARVQKKPRAAQMLAADGPMQRGEPPGVALSQSALSILAQRDRQQLLVAGLGGAQGGRGQRQSVRASQGGSGAQRAHRRGQKRGMRSAHESRAT